MIEKPSAILRHEARPPRRLPMPITIRALVESDLPTVDRILQAAFERTHSFESMLRLNGAAQPGNQLVAVERGQVVGTVGAVDYGQLAYVALMGVDPAFHGRGIARQLMQHVLSRLDAGGCPIVLLDATEAGAAIYEKLGFVDDSFAYEYQDDSHAAPGVAPRENAPPHPSLSRQGRGFSERSVEQEAVRAMTAADLAEVTAFDAPRFGADRGGLLRILFSETPDRALVARDADGQVAGYAFARGVLGPWVADDTVTTEQLFTAARALPSQDPLRVLVPRSNSCACALLGEYGLRPIRQLRHMRRGGAKPPGQPSCLFGQVSFGLG
jgi:predicted N-acetyltransferase YhbS